MSNLTNQEKDIRPEVFTSDLGVRRSHASRMTDKPHTMFKAALHQSYRDGGLESVQQTANDLNSRVGFTDTAISLLGVSCLSIEEATTIIRKLE